MMALLFPRRPAGHLPTPAWKPTLHPLRSPIEKKRLMTDFYSGP
jgi:hypothetical protein